VTTILEFQYFKWTENLLDVLENTIVEMELLYFDCRYEQSIANFLRSKIFSIVVCLANWTYSNMTNNMVNCCHIVKGMEVEG
jgi:hypothetical protein